MSKSANFGYKISKLTTLCLVRYKWLQPLYKPMYGWLHNSMLLRHSELATKTLSRLEFGIFGEGCGAEVGQDLVWRHHNGICLAWLSKHMYIVPATWNSMESEQKNVQTGRRLNWFNVQVQSTLEYRGVRKLEVNLWIRNS